MKYKKKKKERNIKRENKKMNQKERERGGKIRIEWVDDQSE